MNSAEPLLKRCLCLTGSFETGKLGADSFSVVAGDFDGMGVSFSCLQWNVGQATLQPLLRQMLSAYPSVVQSCFGELTPELTRIMAPQPTPVQLAWARSIQGPMNHAVIPEWKASFAALGATLEWQAVAQQSAAGYFSKAQEIARVFSLASDRGIALCFDIAVQDGGVGPLTTSHILDEYAASPDWDEAAKMRSIANALADSVGRFSEDVRIRKLTIANGAGVVHGVQYNLSLQFGL